MSINVRRIDNASNAEAFADIVLANSSTFTDVLHPDGITSNIRRSTIDKVVEGLKDPNGLFYLAETTEEPKKAVGCAKWGLFETPYEGEPEPVTKEVPGIRTDLRREFSQKLWEGRQLHTVGKRYLRK
jgi:hypothetical protein